MVGAWYSVFMRFYSPASMFSFAGMAGIGSVLFTLGTLLAYPGFVLNLSPELVPSPIPIFVQLIGSILYIVYLCGFVFLGKKYHSKRLTIASYSLIFLLLMIEAVSALSPSLLERDPAIIVVTGLAVATCVVLTGWAVFDLRERLGLVGMWYGLLAMLAGTGVLFIIHPYAAIALDTTVFLLGSVIFFTQRRA